MKTHIRVHLLSRVEKFTSGEIPLNPPESQRSAPVVLRAGGTGHPKARRGGESNRIDCRVLEKPETVSAIQGLSARA